MNYQNKHFSLVAKNIFHSLLLLCIAGTSTWSYPTSIDEDGMLRVDGERRFVIGLYQTAEDEAFAKEMAEAGFNLIRAKATQNSMDLAYEQGLQCWIPLGGIAVSSDSEKENLKSLVNQYKTHPALAVWEGPDEILWNVWWRRWNRAIDRWNKVEKAIRKYKSTTEETQELDKLVDQWKRCRNTARYKPAEDIEEQIRKIVGLNPANERLSDWRKHLQPLYEQLSSGTKLVRETDPNHVIWFNHAPRNSMRDLKRFGTVADIVGCDIYPVPFGPRVGHSDLPERNLPCVGAYTRRMQRSAPDKPVWMVLQGFGWDDLGETSTTSQPRPQPTLHQTRFMAYDTIVNGARGILYWGTFAIKEDAQLWEDLKTVVSELHTLQPFLAAPDENNKVKLKVHPSSSSDVKSIRWLAKEHDGDWIFILVNEADHPLSFELSGLDDFNDRQVKILDSTETLVVEDGKINYGLSGLGVGVLSLER